MAAVLHHSRAKGTAKLLLVGIANHDGDGGAWPSVRTLAAYCNVDPSTVKRARKQLVALGEVEVHLQAGGPRDMEDHDRPNRYVVLVDCPEGCDRSRHHRPRKGWRREVSGEYVRAEDELTLWTNPGGASAPGCASAPTPGAPVRPEPPINQPSPQVPTSVTGPGARGVVDTTPPCADCSAPNLTVCRQRDALVPRHERHAYVPSR